MDNLPLIFHGALVHGALYLLMAFIGGIVENNPLAWKLAIAAAGVSYLSYSVQSVDERAGNIFVLISILLGAAAGIALLI